LACRTLRRERAGGGPSDEHVNAKINESRGEWLKGLRLPSRVSTLQPDILPIDIAEILQRTLEGLVDWILRLCF
jgi:hypothetical protein